MQQTIIALWTKSWLSKKGVPFCFLEQAKSSNDLAKEQAFKNANNFVIFLVTQQNQGRGYENKKWEDSDLMISFLWEGHLKKITAFSCEDFASDLQKALKTVWPVLPLRVKAPNDLYLGNKKTAGILLEVLHQGSETALIVGLGLNVFSYPRNLKATCLAEHTKDIHLKNWEIFLENLFSLWSKKSSLNN